MAVTWVPTATDGYKDRCYIKNNKHAAPNLRTTLISAKIGCIKTEGKVQVLCLKYVLLAVKYVHLILMRSVKTVSYKHLTLPTR